MAIVEQLAKDKTLSAFDLNLAEILIVPANGEEPNPGKQGEAIVDGLAADPGRSGQRPLRELATPL